MKTNSPKILSVGGSIIIPKTGFDIAFLKAFRSMILARVKKGERFILIIGGGATCRQYQTAAAAVVPMSNVDLDWLGIHTTIFNAQFVKSLFKGLVHDEVITNPKKKIKSKKPIIIGAGYKPGASTDMDAVLLAQVYGAKEILNLSNIEYVYTKDPNIFPDAVKIEQIGWKQFRKEIVGNSWVAGKNAPFDPIASKLAEKMKLTVKILKGTELTNVEKALSGQPFTGTTITAT